MKLSRFVPFLVVAGTPLLLVAACGGSQAEPGSEKEASAEAGPDVIVGENDATTTPEVGADAGSDGTMDTGTTDTGADSTIDSGENDGTSPETGVDAGLDATTMMMDVETTDAGSDSTTETGTVQDTGAEVGAEAAVEAGPDATIMDAALEAMSEASVDAPADSMGTVDAGSDAPADTGGGEQSEGGSDAGDGGCTLSTADSGVGGTLNWAKNFGTTGGMSPTCVAIAPSTGDVVIGGGFTGTVDFGGGFETSHDVDAADPGEDTFVAKFDPGGNYIWAKTFGNGLEVGANSVAVDGSGNVALAGVFQGSVSFGGSTLTALGNTDIFIVEFDATGTFLWSKSFGVAGQYQGLDTVAVDSAGNVLIAGVSNSANFGGGDMTGYYIAKFTSSGASSWSEAFAASCDESSPMLAVDGQGNEILAGCFVGTVDFGGGTLTTASFDAFVAKFDSTGTYQWAKQYGDSNGADVSDVAVDTCGNIFVIGSFFGTINFGSGALSATDSTKAYAFLAKIDATGNGAWSEDFIGSNVDALYPGSLAVDGAGGPTFSCGLAGSVDYGGGTLTSESSTAATMSVASFSASGAYRWAYEEESPSTASSGTAVPQGVAASESSMVVLGEFGGSGMTLALPGKTLTAVSGNDTFVASFAP